MDEVEQLLSRLEEDEPRQAVESTREYLETHEPAPQQRSKLTYGLAVGFFKLGSYEKAIRWLKKTDEPRRWLMIGFALLRLERFEDAARAFDKAGESQPGRRNQALLLQANALVLGDNTTQARHRYDELMERSPGHEVAAEARFERGRMEAEEENVETALGWLQEVLDHNADSPFALEAALLMVRLHRDQDRIERALDRARWIKNRADDPEWTQLGKELVNRLQNEKSTRVEQLRDYEF